MEKCGKLLFFRFVETIFFIFPVTINIKFLRQKRIRRPKSTSFLQKKKFNLRKCYANKEKKKMFSGFIVTSQKNTLSLYLKGDREWVRERWEVGAKGRRKERKKQKNYAKLWRRRRRREKNFLNFLCVRGQRLCSFVTFEIFFQRFREFFRGCACACENDFRVNFSRF